MPTSFKIDAEKGRVICQARGVVTLVDLEEHHRRLVLAPGYRADMAVSWDLREVTKVDHSASKFLEFEDKGGKLPQGKRAVLIGDGEATQFMQVWVLHRRARRDGRIRVFRDPGEAEAWLQAPEPST
jgi:hypothetical protein